MLQTTSEVIDYDGRILIKLPFAGEWMTKASLYPTIVNNIRQNRKVGNHLYNLFHRGNTEKDSVGVIENPYVKTKACWENN